MYIKEHVTPEANTVIVCRYLEEVMHRGNVAAIDTSIANVVGGMEAWNKVELQKK